MQIMHLALGGCLCPPPVPYGLTEDTGGHIAYVLGAAEAQARHPGVTSVQVVTRVFDDPRLGARFALARERLAPRCEIVRIATARTTYLAKEALEAELPAFALRLIAELAGRGRLPDAIHAHFADAAFVARRVRDALGIPYVYTAHSLAIEKRSTSPAAGSAALSRRIELETAAIAGSAAVIGSSRDECERQLLAYDGADVARIHKVPPGIRVPERPAAEEGDWLWIDRFLVDRDLPMILAVARPVAKKNLVGLVEMFGTHPDLRHRANLVLLAGLRDGVDGDGEAARVHRGLLAAIDRHDLHGHVAYPRRHSQAQVGQIFARAARGGGIFANPALTEPFGLTIQEAAAHGLPVVATCHGGPGDIVAALGHGVVADPLDPPAFAAAMADLLADERLRASFATRGIARARDAGWDRYAAATVRILHGIIKPPRRRQDARRLVVCDIDNTLTGCGDGARAFARWRAGVGGVHFAVATGRSLSEARAVLAEWGLPEPDSFLTSVGSEIYTRDADGTLRLDTSFHAATAAPWPRARIEALLDGLPRQLDMSRQPPIEQRTGKLSWFASADAARHVHRALAKADLPAKVVHSHGDLLDILPPTAGKGAAVRHLLSRLDLSDERCLCFGDSGNDLDFIDAGLPTVLVANHAAELLLHRTRPNVRVAPRAHAWGVLDFVATDDMADRDVA